MATLALPSLRSSLMVAHHCVTGGLCVAVCYPHLLGGQAITPWGQYVDVLNSKPAPHQTTPLLLLLGAPCSMLVRLQYHKTFLPFAGLSSFFFACGSSVCSTRYDLVFFFGLTEVSTIPLALHDALKHLPRHLAANSALAALDEVVTVTPSINHRISMHQSSAICQ